MTLERFERRPTQPEDARLSLVAFAAESRREDEYARTHPTATADMRLRNRYPDAFVPKGTAAIIEHRALYHAENFAPTPDNLGREGCMAAISKWIIGPMLHEQGKDQQAVSLFNSGSDRSSSRFIHWFKSNRLGTVREISQRELTADMLQPGEIVIAQKRDGSQHAMVVTRIPDGWGAPPGARAFMFVGNTGMDLTRQEWFKTHPDGTPPYPHFHLMQEVIGDGTGHFNKDHQQVNSSSPNNPYLGGRFFILLFN